MGFKCAGLAQLAARQSHNLKVVSSNLTFRIIFLIAHIELKRERQHHFTESKSKRRVDLCKNALGLLKFEQQTLLSQSRRLSRCDSKTANCCLVGL